MKIVYTLRLDKFTRLSKSIQALALLLVFTLSSFELFAAVPPPGVTKVPAFATVCKGSPLSITLSGIPVGGCTCNYQQQYMLPGESAWTSMAIGASIVPTSAGSAQIRARIQCTGGAGCDTSAWTTVSWNVVDLPSTPGAISRFPDSDICIGASVSATANGSTGGTGSCYYLYTFFHSGRTEPGYTTTNTYNSDTIATLYVKARYYCDGYGCDTSNYANTNWTVISDPLAPSFVKNPNLDSVCVGASVTVSSTTNSGGTGTCNDVYRYSDNGGTSWSSWSTTIPVVTVVNPGQIVKIQGRKECDGTGCNSSDTTQSVWKGISDPTWGTTTISTDSVCNGGAVTLTTSVNGGSGGTIQWHRYYTSPYTDVMVSTPNTAPSPRTYYYYPQYLANPSNSGCNLDTGRNMKLVMIADPSWSGISVTPANDCIGASISLTVNLNGGLGGGSYNWLRDVISLGPGITVTNPDTPPSVGTYYYRPHYNPPTNPRGCNLNDGTQRTVNIYALPISQDINGTPVAGTNVCVGATISATFSGGTNSLGSETDEYEFSINGGATWSNYTPGGNISATQVGANTVQIRTRKVASGTSCNSDWNTSTWSVSAALIAPSLLVKTPNVTSVCAGTLVNATITPGSGGVGCSDVIEFSIDNGANWNAYTSGQVINSSTATEIIIRAWRGNCDASSGCANTSVVEIARWSVTSAVIAATLTPAGGQECSGTSVSAAVNTPGSGGSGCSDIFLSRYRSSGIWSGWITYTPGNNISSTGRDSIQIQSIRSCDPLSGCADTNIYSWVINNYTVVSPTLSKSPNLATVCQGTNVSASLLTAGSGGNGCSDYFEYRTNNGAWTGWMSYILGTGIPTVGLSGVEIRTWRANCLPGGICGDSTINTYAWTVVPQPTAPTIARYPLAIIICNTDTVRGTISWGTGGTGCTNYAQYRIKTGATWSAWYAYTSGQDILANGRTEVEIKAWTGNCSGSAGCVASDTAFENWTVSPNLVNPTLTRLPNRTSICEEEFASATLNIAGSGGINCSDIFEYRTNNGSWSAWFPFSLGTNIPGTGLNTIEIQGYRGNCDLGSTCNTPAPYVISWTVVATSTPPLITRVPDQDEVCAGTSVSATITSGAGGISCFDYRQYRYYNGTSWSAWTAYTSGNAISTTGRTIIQVRTFRGCQPTTGCLSTDTSTVEWNVVSGIIHPTMSKIPSLDTVCQGVSISAIIATAGSGGVGCSDTYEYRIKTAGSWGGWNPYNPSNAIPTDLSTEGVEVRATRDLCSSGIICGSPTGNTYSWVVVPLPIAPGITRVPNSDYICSGQTASVTTTPGSGYSCSDYFQYRRYNGSWSAWAFYPAGYNIPSTGYTEIEVRGYNRNCNSTSGCTPDTNTVSWTVSPPIVAPTLTKTPNVTSICEGFNVSALISGGSGGIDCSNSAEYTVDGTNWLPYVSETNINTFGAANVIIRAFRNNCNPLVLCPSSDTVSVSWTVSPQPIGPVLTRVPDLDLVCQGSSVSASIVAGSGGVSCTDFYKYRYHNGTTWSAWATYTVGSNLSTVGRTQIEIMGYRTCGGTGCINTDTSTVHWDVDATITNPTLAKNPNVASVCDGDDVWATIATPGSGGTGCSDVLEYSIDGGVSWAPYTDGTHINTTSLTSVRIRAYRGNCVSGGCTPTDTNALVWTITMPPTNPLITRNPNTDDVCYGTAVSAIITAGTGGTSCTNYANYRIYNGSTWTTWYNYTSGNNIVYPSNAQIIELRAFRGNCSGGCASSDTTTTSWNIIQGMINPILAKNPNTATVVENLDVSATILVPGSNGSGCDDVLEYRVNTGAGYGAWSAYADGNLLSTTGLTAIQIRGFRGNCSGGDICPAADTTIYSWTVVQGPQAPTVLRNPDLDDVCVNTPLSATIIINGGGVGCTDYAQYRTYNGTVWTAWATYVSGNNIAYPAGTAQVQVRAFRGNCDPISGDVCSDTTLVNWNIVPSLINPILLKNPNIAAVCSGIDVAATIQTSGSGGTSCSDLLQFRADNGSGFSAWQPYIPGDPISTTGFIQVQIRGFRGGCLSGLVCPPADTTVYSWNVSAAPIAPIIARNPNLNDVCSGTLLSATITPGTGGSGCTEYYQSRNYNGSAWTAWTAYTSGANIAYGSTISRIEIRAFRGNCDIASGCTSSDTTTAFWNILPALVRPQISKSPALASICEGVDVSAVITTPGSGGVGCSDIMEYRTNNGSGFGAWTPYIGGTLISSIGLTGVEIRANHENCTSGDECPAADTVVSWIINPGPIAPTLLRVPDQNSVCRNTLISAIVTPGSEGDGCSDIAEYRLYNGATWSIWSAYTSGNNIVYNANTSQVEARTYRAYCDIASGCTSSDTNIVSWLITDNLANPILAKNPNIDSICAGINVSASILTPGSGGTGCADLLEYRVNSGSGFSAWFAYGENDLVPTVGYTEVQIRGTIGNCVSGDECPPSDTIIYSWIVNPSLIAPLVTRIPDQDVVCRGTVLSATITPGVGGNECTEYYQYRKFNGSTWTAWGGYVSGNPIAYNAADFSVQVRAFRGNCNLASGCAASDTVLVNWDIHETLINPILDKYPDVDAICNVDNVSAGISVPGSGGVGCSDILEYRTNNGAGFTAWAPYGSSDAIPTAGYTEIQVRGFIGNCVSGDECPPADTTIYSWTIQSVPIAPTIARNPNTNDVCASTPISATITPGSGGTSCTEVAQYRLFNGSAWSAWTNYTSGNVIPTLASTANVEVRAFRGNCNPLSGCPSSDTSLVSWNILKDLVNPILQKNPNVAAICQGTDVAATILTPGSGGVGCSDILQYRTNNGAGYSSWFAYSVGDPIPSFGLTAIDIRGFIGNCSNGSQCPPVDTLIYTWTVSPSPTAPIITRIPNLDTVCRGTLISATIIAGTGGTSCSDTYQKRTFNGSTWSAWSAYTSGSNIVYAANITQIEVRGFRGGCDPLSGCINSDTTLVHWFISEQPVNPILAKTPNVASVCDGTLVNATVTTPGSGGSGCTDAFEYRTFDGTTWSAWANYTPPTQIVTTGITRVQIIGYRDNCDAGSSCTPPAADTVSWLVVPQTTDPSILRVPDENSVCFGTTLSATITTGIGGSGCTNFAEKRTFDGTTWTAWSNYVSGSNIAYGATITRVEVRAFRGNCDASAGCLSSDTALTGWDISAQPIGPVLAKLPNVSGICVGVDVSASITTPGNGGIGCTDIFEYRTNNGSGFTAWAPYTPPSLIATAGMTQVEIRSYRGNCLSATCSQTTPVVLNWTVSPLPTAPTLTAIPANDTICEGTLVSATAIAGTGGSGCADTYQYRTNNGTTWSAWLAYTPANTVITSGLRFVEIRGFRACDPASGCVSNDTSLVQWSVFANLVSPIMAKTPNVDTVCEGNNVSATLISAGSGGTSCMDIFDYSINGGASWATYIPGTAISTVGRTNIQIRFYRGGCIDAGICGGDTTNYTWIVVPPIVAPTLAKNPDIASLCQGTDLSATVTAGSGGANCADIVQYRTNNGTIWSAWMPYISNTNISSVGLAGLEIRAYRGNCSANALCIASDTSLVSWIIFPQPVAPILAQNPTASSVCEGTDVSASLTTAGSGGSNCSDVIQYRTNAGSGYGAWLPYTPPTAIPTTGLTAVQIISYRGNCDPGSLCIQTPVDTITWAVVLPIVDPSIVRIPDADTLCSSAVVSAIITPASGGVGCTNYTQYRIKVGLIWSGWMNYTSGNTIPHGLNVPEVQVRTFRGNCLVNSGCGSSDTAFVSWVFTPNPEGPVMQKNPDIMTVCEGSSVNATVITPGTGGYGCSDIINYRTNNGSGYSGWLAYTPGAPIFTTGLTRIQIVSQRGNCNPLASCSESTADTILWLVVPGTSNPSVARIPDEDTLCRGSLVSAIITNGTGGDGCTNYSEYRTFNGTSWSAWTNYTSSAIIPYAADVIRIEVQAFRGNCTAGAGCASSDTITAFWNINPQPIAPIFTKVPDVAGVCDGTSVSAILSTPGSGGVGCSDNSEYRIHNGTSWSSWLSYTSGTSIVTTGLTQVEIRSWRGACPIVGCNSTDTTVLHWDVSIVASQPNIARTPDQDLVCQGTLVSATITPGSGGSGCNDISEFRTLTTGIWTSWTNYTSGSTINSSGIDSIEVRSYRICPPVTGCPSTDTNMVAWKVANSLLMPVLAKIPNTDSICETTMIGANLVTPGSGGSGCADIYEISTNGGATWSAYIPGTLINSAGLTDVRVRFVRAGCPEATLCGAVPTEFKWIIVPQPVAPTMVANPAIDGVCEGTPVSATIVPGDYGVGCSDVYQSRTFNGATWSAWIAYTSGTVINNAGLDSVQIRAYRGNCNATSGCFATDTTTITWAIYPQPIAPVIAGTPSTSDICEGTDVSAAIVTPGSGGAGCSDTFEYHIDNGGGYGAWMPYVPPTIIPTAGVTAIQIISYRGNCNPGSLCVQTAVDTISWFVLPPVTDPIIVRNPDIDTLCAITPLFATITPASGGVGCSDFSQFRLKVGAVWTGWLNYTSGNVIPHGVNVGEVQIRAFRGNCVSNSGCATSDTAFVNWILFPDPVNPVLLKNPNSDSVCSGFSVTATLVTPGTDGSGCSDQFNYRTDDGTGYGAWTTYLPGTSIPTSGLTQIQIVSQRGNCNPLANCNEPVADTILWLVAPGTTAPTILRTPNVDTICNGTPVSALITDGVGGSGCQNFSQFRIFDGTSWTAWADYTSNNIIPYPAISTQIEVRAFRGNCDLVAGCSGSDTIIASWVIAPQPTNPVLTKIPNVASVCAGSDVSATILTPGTGGSGCSDIFEYRTDNGSGYSLWNSYTIGSNINTAGLIAVQISAHRGNCNVASACAEPIPDTLTWMVVPQPVAPIIARVPDIDSICSNSNVSGLITAGSGGAGCSDVYEYRTSASSTWSAWQPYLSGVNIPTTGYDEIQIRGYRTNCQAGSGCNGSDTNSVDWIVMPPVVSPTLVRVPNVENMCQNSLVQANLVTPGSGGLGCSDVFEYRTNNGAWSAWLPYTVGTPINSAGISTIQIISYRGNCNPAALCDEPLADTLTWNFVAPPIPPTVIRVPDNNICSGDSIFASITPGSGGLGCSDTYQYRLFDGTSWSAWAAYTSGTNIPYLANTTQAEVRVYRANCDPASGCDIADTNSVLWLISPQIIAPVMAKIPDIIGVCDGTPVSATLTSAGSGGLGCSDTYEYRTNNGSGFGAWMPYVPATDIPSLGLTEIEIRFARANCDPLNGCPPPAPVVFNWIVAPQPVAPTIVKFPAADSICAGPMVYGTITPGSGGIGCTDVYEYRILDTLGSWSLWIPYLSDSLIATDTVRDVQIRISRTNCLSGSGCTSPAPTVVEWIVFPQPIVPVLTRIPDQDAVCETTLLTATQSGDTGGVPPSTIEYQFENPGEWTWNPGNSFVPNANGMAYIRARSTSNGYGCIPSEWEWVSWIVDPKPVITSPENQTICQGGSTQIDALVAGGYGTVNYIWETSTVSCAGPWTIVADSTRSSLVTGPLSDTTWYRITATQQATSCFDVSSCIAINVKPAPIVTIAGNALVCSGGTTLTANVANQPNPVIFQWQYSNSASGPWVNTGTNSNTLTIDPVIGATFYQCTVVGDTIGCSATSTPTLVQLGTAPVLLSHSSDTAICNGQNIFLNVVAQSIPAPTYQWVGPLGAIVGATSDTLFINNAQIADTGSYYCIIMSFCDTITSPNMHVTVLQDLVDATTIVGTIHRCQGAGFDLYSHDAQNVLTTSWFINPSAAGTINSTGLVSWNSAFSGTAHIEATIQGCDTVVYHYLDVIVDTAVVAPVISGTFARCQGVGTDQYSATSPGASAFVWSISNGGSSTIDNATGLVTWDSAFVGITTIYAYAIGCGGPSLNGEYQVVTIDSVTFTQSGSQSWCENDSNALWVSPNPNAGNTFQWYNSVGEILGATDSALVFNPVLTINQGAYFCRIITVCGDTIFSTPDTITVHPLPAVDFLIAGACRLDSIHFINLSTITDGTISYQWTFGDGNVSTDINPTHIYLVADTFNVVLTATSSWGCSKSFSQMVIIHELPQATVTTIGDSCNSSGRGSIIVAPTFGTPPFSYLINGGLSQLDSIFTPLPAGSYIITVVDSNNCRSNLQALITQPSVLKTHIYPYNVLCYNDSSGIANLEVIGGTEPYQYLWSNGQMNQNLTNVPIGNYGVAVMDANGCTAFDSVSLIQPNPLIVDSLVVQTSCTQINDGKIFVFVSGGIGGYNYLWNTGEILDSIVNLAPNRYQITVTDANGCNSIHDYLITTNNNDCITIWTSFSPDGDGTNDVWNIGHIELYPECVVQIYNRWGAQLFESKGYHQPWDGTWKQKELPPETYYFVITLGDGSAPITGTVTIIR